MLSVVGSIVDHRAKLPSGQIRAVLAEIAEPCWPPELPERSTPSAAPAVAAPPSVGGTKYEALLDESMRLFNQNGYRDTTMEDIAAAVGMPASGIYRYFRARATSSPRDSAAAADCLSADLPRCNPLSTIPRPH